MINSRIDHIGLNVKNLEVLIVSGRLYDKAFDIWRKGVVMAKMYDGLKPSREVISIWKAGNL